MLDFKALLFDLDGTLLDTAPDFISAINKQLKNRGLKPLIGDAVRTSVTHGSIGIIESAYNIEQDHPEFDSLKNEFLELYLANIAEKTAMYYAEKRAATVAQHNKDAKKKCLHYISLAKLPPGGVVLAKDRSTAMVECTKCGKGTVLRVLCQFMRETCTA